MARHAITDAAIIAQIPAARAREAKARRAGLRAKTARYDRASGRIVMELTNGCAFAFPAGLVPGLATATPGQIAALEVLSGGSGLVWEALNADIGVPALLLSSFGRRQAASALGRIGGSATSVSKARASRANGAKGGRPRKAASR
jgi:hypothetical protein